MDEYRHRHGFLAHRSKPSLADQRVMALHRRIGTRAQPLQHEPREIVSPQRSGARLSNSARLVADARHARCGALRA